MDTAETRFQGCIEKELTRYDGKVFAAEKDLGLPKDALRSVFRGDRKQGTSLNRAKQICDALGLEFYIGPPRATQAGGFQDGTKQAFQHLPDFKPPALVAIPYHARDLAHRDLSGLALSQDWIDAAQLDAHALTAVVMPSDDMAPMIGEGAVLLVDGRADPQPEPQLHAFAAQGRLRVGWLCLPRAGSLVAFFARSFSPPVIQKARGGTLIEPLGRIVGRFDDVPQLWIDATEKSRLLDTAKELTKPKKA